MSNIKNLKIISIPKISDPQGRGNLSFVEKNIIPFKIKRVSSQGSISFLFLLLTIFS